MPRGQVRIIGGEYRGRKLKISPLADIRPTPDRVRETLFNWLAPIIAGSCCLDLFTGSGALGFEALSRGASHVTMVDQSIAVVKLISEEIALFGAKNAAVYQAKIPREWPNFFHKIFDIVFLDPPYHENLLLPLCKMLEEKRLLAHPAFIYLESNDALDDTFLPANWNIIKHKKAGQVNYYLVKRKGETYAEAMDTKPKSP